MLFLKLVRDIRKNLLSAITIVIITALGVTFWSGFEGIASNGAAITEGFYESCAMPDLFLTGNRFTAGDLREMRLNGADLAMGRNAADMTVPALEDAALRVYAQALPPALNKPVVIQGSLTGMNNPRNMLLDDDFMRAHDLVPGDKLRLLYEDRFYEFTVIAGVKTPENIYLIKDVSTMIPDHTAFGYAFIPEAAAWDMLYGGEAHVYNQVVLTTGRPDAMKEYLSRRFAGQLLSVTGRSEQLSASMVELEFSTIGSIVGVFPTVFFIIAALISFTSLRRLVDKERTAIGTMKALGVRDGAVLAHYTAYGLLYGTLAAAVGIPLGLLIPKAMFAVMDMFFSFPPYVLTLNYRTSAIAGGTAVLVSVLASFWACKGTLSLAPSVCMKPKSTKPGKKILLERVPLLWNRLGDIRKVILRNMFRNKDRMLMSIFGITCSCAMLFIAFGMQSSINNLMTTVYEKVNCYDMKVYFKPSATPEQAARVAGLGASGAGELIMETGAKVTGTTGLQKTASITVVPDATRLLGIYDGRDFTEPLPADGCILSDVLARELGVGEGDTLSVNFTGQKKVFFFTVRKVIVQNFGQGIFVSQSAWRKTGEGFSPTAALLPVESGIDEAAYLKHIKDYDFVLDAQYQSQLKASLESDMQMSNISVYMMIFFAGLMAFIVLFNLGILNFYEREREIATLKVVGFTDREVRKMAFGENYLFVLTGGGLGLFWGNLALDSMLAMVETEHYTFTKSLAPSTFAYTLLTLFLFAILTNLFLGRYVRRIDLISALKAVE